MTLAGLHNVAYFGKMAEPGLPESLGGTWHIHPVLADLDVVLVDIVVILILWLFNWWRLHTAFTTVYVVAKMFWFT